MRQNALERKLRCLLFALVTIRKIKVCYEITVNKYHNRAFFARQKYSYSSVNKQLYHIWKKKTDKLSTL